jgi:hypothetical protein
MDIIKNNLDSEIEKKGFFGRRKEMKIPRRAKVRKGKAKKGWVGIIKINETGIMLGEKVKVEDSAYITKDGIYHATDGREKIMWAARGKMFPVYFQLANKINPINFFSDNQTNETYGQKYIMAKMLKDTIKVKKGFNGGIIIWIIVAIAAFFAAKYIFKF